MKRNLIASGMALLMAVAAQAQNTNLAFPPGKIAVFKAGTPDNAWNISSARSQPCYVQVFDPAVTNPAPLLSMAMSTNASIPGSVWINAHAGSEGGGISRTIDRQFLMLEGYTGNILSPTDAKPSNNTGVNRGIVRLDAFTNAVDIYHDSVAWFGLPAGCNTNTYQDNPTGIASTDGTNIWGTGNFAGTSSELDGTLYYNTANTSPYEVQNYLQGAYEARIIGGTLYVVVTGGGVYNFVDPANNRAVVPLPFDPNVANPVEHATFTNLFLSWGSTYSKIANFDMNAQGTVAYGADQTYGIVKFTNNGSAWQKAYLFSATNIGTLGQKSAAQGCFGICVDFTSSTNPIIYATTMEAGTTSGTQNAQGNANQNRLIRIVDTNAPGINLVAVTLARANTTNEVFRGIDFTPDLRPFFLTQPLAYSTTNGGVATFSPTVQSVYDLSYQWLQNSNVLGGATNLSLTLSNLTTATNGYVYQLVATNLYGAVTSSPAILTVTASAVAPVIGGTAASVVGYIGGNVTFAPVVPISGTQPFAYQWYVGANGTSIPLTDDGVKYAGSATSSLTISNLVLTDSTNYYIVVSNAGGYASNKVDVLTVKYVLPTIAAGQPAPTATFVGYPTSVTAGHSGGTEPVTYQWYSGNLTNNTLLTDGTEFSGTATTTLTIAATTTADTTNYFIVASNPGGSVTSSVAAVSVLLQPAHSSLSYSNQLYFQNFDSLPDPGLTSQNSINNPLDPGNIGTNFYSLANPFDFTYPVVTSGYIGGLGLATMNGWYGSADTLYSAVDGITRFGAQNGDQTTGGVIDFGPNDGAVNHTNRALGLLSTSTTGATSFGLKLVNTSGQTLNYISLAYIGELWHNGTGTRTISFGYTVDPTANSFVLNSQSISNATLVPQLNISFPTALSVTTIDGTQPANQQSFGTNYLALTTPWTPGSALWLIWSIDFYGSGSGNGYAIDNLSFSAAPVVPSLPISITSGSTRFAGTANTAGASYQFGFTNAPGLSFSVLSTTNIAKPVSQWQRIGSPVEVTPGVYQFTNTAAASSQTYYLIRQP